MAVILCPGCQGRVQMPDEMQGMQVVCPLCQATFQAPQETPEPSVPETTDAIAVPPRGSHVRRRRRSILNLEEETISAPEIDIALPPRSLTAAEAVRGPAVALQVLGTLQIGIVAIAVCAGVARDRLEHLDHVALALFIAVAFGILQLVAGHWLRNFRNPGLIRVAAVLSAFSCIGLLVCIWVFATLSRPEVRAAFDGGGGGV
jgi:hypothetical protein